MEKRPRLAIKIFRFYAVAYALSLPPPQHNQHKHPQILALVDPTVPTYLSTHQFESFSFKF